MKDQLAPLYLAIRDFVAPIERHFASPEALEYLFHRYGWVAPLEPPTFAQVAQVPAFRSALTSFIAVVDELGDEPEAIDAEELAELAAVSVDLLSALARIDSTPGPGLLAPFDQSDFWRSFGEHLLDDLLDEYIRIYWPKLYLVLRLWGVIRYDEQRPSEPFRRPYTRVSFVWDQLLATVRNPVAALRDSYHFADPGQPLEYRRALDSLLMVLHAMRLPATLFAPAITRPAALPGSQHEVADRALALRTIFRQMNSDVDQSFHQIGLDVLPAIAAGQAVPSGFLLRPLLAGGKSIDLPIGESLGLRFGTDAALDQAIGVTVFPDGIAFVGGDAAVGTKFELKSKNDTPWYVAGNATSSRVELAGLSLSAELTGVLADPELAVRLVAERLAMVLVPSSSDSRTALLGKDPRRFITGLDMRWSSKTGLSLGGADGIEFSSTTPYHIGGVTLDSAKLGIDASGPAFRLAATVSGSVALGPVTVSVQDIGVMLELRSAGGGAHALDVDMGFKPPSGVGVAVDAGPVRGGGFVAFDQARDDYKGALTLDVMGALVVNALALVTTHTPNQRVSLVASISGEFSPIQLGLGFTLNGVGGLLGVHRRVDTDALRTALRGSGIGDIFFAPDPVAHAARLLSDMGRYFPVAEGRHVFGPAVKIGWGTPSIIEGKLAVLLEVPNPVRLVLLGNVRTALPSKDDPLVVINVDVVGEVDFSKKLIAVDASLRDSKVVDLPITGDLAFRMCWGDPPVFVLSIGGFHSQFRPPAGFPKLRRVTIPVGSGDNPRLDASGFLALTSNTAQVGAQVELYAAAGGLNIRGSIGFEALIEFSPFSFRADLSAGVSLRRHNSVLASVHLDATLTGPTPWRVCGEACLSLWFVDLCVDFDATFGRSHAVELPQREPWKPLQLEVQRKASWTGVLPTGAVRAVTTAPMFGQSPESLIDPHAVLTLRQKVLPLNRKLTRFAQGKPSGADHFNLTEVKLGGVVVPAADIRPVKDWFAPAQFEELPASERLARDGFEQMDAGVAVASGALKVGSSLVCPLEYETVVVRTGPPEPKTLFSPTLDAQLAGAARSSVARAPLRVASLGPFAPPPGTTPAMAIKEEEHVVVSTADLSRRLDIIGNMSRGEAKLALAAYLELHPGERGSLQVVPSHEAA